MAGPIGAGKSFVADELAAVYGGIRSSFGSVVRRRAEARGLPVDRRSLQELGDEIIAKDGWGVFCREVLSDPTDDALVVVDGIRHVGAIDALVAIVGPTNFRLVYVDSSRSERLARLVARDGITQAELEDADTHSNERELPAVRERADVVIANERGRPAKAQLLRQVVTRLEHSGFDPG